MRILVGGTATFVGMFVLGGVWNAVLMAQFYAAHAPSNARLPEQQSMLFVALGYVALSVFMTFLFAQSFGKRPALIEGFQFGALFGVIATLPLYLILFGIWNISLTHVIVDTAWHLCEQGVGGVILALTLRPAVRDGVVPSP